jgi:DNA-binding transcriptional ArsR family regulator
VRAEIDRRLDELRPMVREREELERALQAIDQAFGRGHGRSASGRTRGRRGGAGRRGRPRRGRRRRAARGQRREEFLRLVKGSPQLTISEAARQMGVSPSQVSNLVRRLEDEGAVTRQDGRFVLVAAAALAGGDRGAGAVGIAGEAPPAPEEEDQ